MKRMNSGTLTTGSLTVSGTNIATYKGVGWMPDGLVPAALAEGWTLVTPDGEMGNTATQRQYISPMDDQTAKVLPDSICGGFLCAVTVGASHGPAGGAIHDCADAADISEANLIIRLPPISTRIPVNQNFVFGLCLVPVIGQAVSLLYR